MHEGTTTAVDYLESQLALEQQAKELMPYNYEECTYSMGPLRQQVYACLTCHKEDSKDRSKILSGICYSCSIQCHGSHQLVELFSKRKFTCDCGTTRMPYNKACRLRTGGNKHDLPAEDVPSLSNEYNHNFEGRFCDCKREYNPVEEQGNMFQCHFGIVCGEDWFHDECIMGKKPQQKPQDEVKCEGKNLLATLPVADADAESENLTRQVERAELPGFPKLDDFDVFVCWKCVSKYEDAISEIPEEATAAKVFHVEESGSEADRDFETKRRKMGTPYSIFLKDGFKRVLKSEASDSSKSLGALLRQFPFLYTEDPVYEPPEESDDDNSSIFDLGARALGSLPRDQAAQGVKAYEDIKSKLTDFLKPFADDGRVVTEDAIKAFFDKMNEEK